MNEDYKKEAKILIKQSIEKRIEISSKYENNNIITGLDTDSKKELELLEESREYAINLKKLQSKYSTTQ